MLFRGIFNFSILGRINLVTDSNLIKAGEDFLSFMWYSSGFETHKQFFLHELSELVSPSRNLMTDLVIHNKATTIVPEIINSLSQEQMQDIAGDSPSSYMIFAEVRNKLSDDSAKTDDLTTSQSSDSSPDIEVSKQEVIPNNTLVPILGDDHVDLLFEQGTENIG